MKPKLIAMYCAVITTVGLSLYLLVPKNDFTPRDEVVLSQISFLVNADICMKDFKGRNGEVPKDMQELLDRCPELGVIYRSFEKDISSIVYINNPESPIRFKIINVRPRLDLELSSNGKISHAIRN